MILGQSKQESKREKERKVKERKGRRDNNSVYKYRGDKKNESTREQEQ